MSSTAYQIKIVLSGSKPKIWRRVVISSDMLLSDLHKVIQTVMGWTNSHLHQFAKGPVILEPMPEYDFMDMTGTDYAGYKINSLLKEKGDNIRYEYDFGDGWEHILTLEKAIEDFDGNLPVCVDGAMNCPPEDIGGIWGFENFKKALKNPNHPEHKMYKEWIGGDYDPEYFDMEVINDLLMEDNYGMFGW